MKRSRRMEPGSRSVSSRTFQLERDKIEKQLCWGNSLAPIIIIHSSIHLSALKGSYLYSPGPTLKCRVSCCAVLCFTGRGGGTRHDPRGSEELLRDPGLCRSERRCQGKNAHSVQNSSTRCSITCYSRDTAPRAMKRV